MRRFLLLTVTLLLLLGACGSTQQPATVLTLEQMFKIYGTSVVEILATPNSEGAVETKFGTGFLVKMKGDQLDVLTAKHVVEEDAVYRIRLMDGTILSLKKVVKGKHDVAFLDVVDRDWKDLKGFELRGAPMEAGATVYVIGSPGAFRWLPTQGNFGMYYTPKDDEGPQGMGGVEYLLFTAPVWYGNSGGPIIDTEGKVCGIVSWMFTQPRHFNF